MTAKYSCRAMATLLGVWWLHERFGTGAALGLALILFGSWWATRGPGVPARRADEAPCAGPLAPALPQEPRSG
jgi:hypothetical protein